MPLLSLTKRYYCVDDFAGGRECYEGDDGFWYTDVCLPSTPCSRDVELTMQQKGIIVKWIILASFFVIFFGWFVGGRIHAKQRLRKGLPLLGYHRVRLTPLPPSVSTPSNTNKKCNSFWYPIRNVAAMAKSPRTTSPFTKHKTPTHPTHSTHRGRTAHGRNPRRCTRTPMRHHNILRHRRPVPPRRTLTKGRRLWRCRCTVHHHKEYLSRRDLSRAV